MTQVHFIFKHKNPKTGEYEEKHLTSAPMARIVKTTSLYTLIVHPDNAFEIKVDGESMKKGNLLDDFTPSVNPEKEIDDPKDTKPDDWVDEARIADPEAKKPEDWDEDAPFEIPDEEAAKPDDWLDNEPAMIRDPEAEKPEDWDDEEDGDWIPPMVPNPKCEEASGCGKWERPSKRNPEYKGKWAAEFIDNPAYKGVWKPKKIANPGYFEDKTPAKFEPMGAVSDQDSSIEEEEEANFEIDWFRNLDHAKRHPLRQHLHRSLCRRCRKAQEPNLRHQAPHRRSRGDRRQTQAPSPT